MDAIQQFFQERHQAIAGMAQDEGLKCKSLDWMFNADRYKYSYNSRGWAAPS